MPSRINMGPDGGPYIAINENSGNIELEDNTGTTVAIWDDANSQWDFQNNPISNVDSLTSNSVNTAALENGVAGDGNVIDGLHGRSGEDHIIGIQTYLPGTSVIFEHTDFQELGGEFDRIPIGDENSLADLTNMDGEVKVAAIVRNRFSSNVSATFRVKNVSQTEVNAPPASFGVSSFARLDAGSAHIEGALDSQSGSDQVEVSISGIAIAKEIQ